MIYDGKVVCGFNQHAEAASGKCYWRINPVKLAIMENRLPNVSSDQFLKFNERVCYAISSVCALDLEPARTAEGANILAYTKRLDGAGGTLAQAWLPCNPRVLVYNQEYDTSEDWWDGDMTPVPRGRIWLYPVLLHETIHSVGLDHGKDIMAPVYNGNVFEIGPDTERRLIALYGRRKAPPPPLPPPDKPPKPEGGNMSFVWKLLWPLIEAFWPKIEDKLQEWIESGALAEWLKGIIDGLTSKEIKNAEDLGHRMAREALALRMK